MMLSGGELAIVALSLRVAVVATLVCLPFALWVAWVLARRSFRGKGALNLLVLLPLVMPPVVTGYALLILFGKAGVFGAPLLAWTGMSFSFRWTGAALAAGVMGFPLMVRALRQGFEAVDPKLEQAAATLGASRWAVFRTVTLPLMMPAIASAMVLGFAKALGEFGATITFVAAIPGETETLPSAIYNALQVPGGEAQAVRLIVVSVVLAVGALALSEWMNRRGGAARSDM